MERAKQKFIVKECMVDDFGTVDVLGEYETYAKTAAQAENQVRYRRGYKTKVTEYGSKAIVFRAY